ncbi:hypothetical protein HK103_003326 [Boothiomyces macroporosus]|uniref:Uncharacterized protein n=1 Tax=Boothiomyces macroporosus TaxID=261099 RepID=A0AAD5UKX0_9FUNG|nr:hypothetical protein HK103_003326 [Boothiomyces macroporosus]
MEDAKLYLKNQIVQAIDYFDYDLGEMLAERLLSFDPHCPDSQFLFAKTLYLGGNIKKALSVIDSTCKHTQSIILYGNCCLKLGNYQEGEVALRRWLDCNHTESPSAVAAVYALIESTSSFLDSIKHNPFYYTSYIGLSDLGNMKLIEGVPLKISDYLNIQKILNKREKPTVTKEPAVSKKRSNDGKVIKPSSREPLASKMTVETRKRVQVNKPPVKKLAGDFGIKLEKENYSIDDLVFVAQKILMAYNAMSLYRCNHSLEVLNSIPKEHLNTGFVLSIAADVFREIRLLAEHDSAIEACKRAIQLDPNFTYAHTLLGHEYLANEDLEASMNSFRQAMRINARHYNAIYGLGLIELKQEKYPVAEHFFRMALQVTPENTILLDVLGQAIQKEKTRNDEALKLFEKALELAPEHRVYLWHKATLLFEMGKYNEVQKILEYEISNTKPDTQVLFLLGRTFAKLGAKQSAIKYMTLAQDYQEHKSSSIIKDSIGKLSSL